ncbi:MAG: DUF5131 family protein [Clostridia bacterium]|nr:DUF5131 family protein [Clostridia bacterium]
MADKTKIDWCDASWNPVTGCFHGCEYCYARRMAHRYAGSLNSDGGLHVLDKPYRGNIGPILFKAEPYPYDFDPTFHRYRLDIPSRWQRPRTIFVCSMADLFGDWVPDEWIQEVFDACRKAPQHRYLFLTKNPDRYLKLNDSCKLPSDKNFWYGSSVTVPEDRCFASPIHNTFLSIEPILSEFENTNNLQFFLNWVIIGAETGNRKNKVIPEAKWIERITETCDFYDIPVFMKSSIKDLMEEDFRQEYPWEVKKDA